MFKKVASNTASKLVIWFPNGKKSITEVEMETVVKLLPEKIPEHFYESQAKQ